MCIVPVHVISRLGMQLSEFKFTAEYLHYVLSIDAHLSIHLHSVQRCRTLSAKFCTPGTWCFRVEHEQSIIYHCESVANMTAAPDACHTPLLPGSSLPHQRASP